jgi:hypothetical protein
MAERQRRVDVVRQPIAHAHCLVDLLGALHHLRTDDHARLAIRADVRGSARRADGWPELRVVHAVRANVLERLAVVLETVEGQGIPEAADVIRDTRRLMIAAEVLRDRSS